MSLVAYNSSDESGQSDAEDDDQGKHVSKTITRTVTSGETDNVVGIKSTNNGSSFPVPVPAVKASQTTSAETDGSVVDLLKGLPAPRDGAEGGVAEEELEEEVKPKPQQVSDAPKPPVKRTKQTVKITIPKLRQDSGDEDEEPVVKKVKVTESGQGKRGLFALLPEPVHAVRKESNRILIPHTLSKRPQAKTTKPRAPTAGKEKSDSGKDEGYSKRYTAFGGLTGYDSDSDDDESSATINFFSLESQSDKSATPTVSSNPDVEDPESRLTSSSNVASDSQLEEASSRTVPVQSAVDDVELPAVMSHVVDSDVSSAEAELPSASFELPTDQDAPLSFKPNLTQPNLLSAAAVSSRYHYYQPTHSSYQPPLDTIQEPQSAEQGDDGYLPEEEVSKYMQDEQVIQMLELSPRFLRLQGKHKRGKEEINIIDANMDDFVNSADVTKNITEESSYQSHRAKDNNPTHQQRRKKQITYLAYQAKEHELELKNTWAANRMTKRQTQAKYGF